MIFLNEYIYNILPTKKLFLKMKYSKRGLPYCILFSLISGLLYNLWFLSLYIHYNAGNNL